MTHPLLAFHRAVVKSVSDTVQSLRRQAPGARMIGEFAVKHVANEANKKLRGTSNASDATPHNKENTPVDSDLTDMKSDGDADS